MRPASEHGWVGALKLGVSLMVMVMGSAMVFGLMVGMNACQEGPKPAKEQARTSFAVAPKPPPPPKPKPKPKPKPRQRADAPKAAAPPPPLGGSALAPGFAMPGFQAAGLQAHSDALLGEAKSSVMTEDAVDAKPIAKARAAAAYPPRARAQGITGFVLLSVLIDERGQVERVKVLEAQPAGVFEESAKEAIVRWSFQPATYKGQAVKTWAKQRIHFKLS